MVVGFASVLGAADFAGSLRRYLSFVLEIYVLYLILSTSVRSVDAGYRIAGSVLFGLTFVALIAAMERNYGINPLAWVSPVAHQVVSHGDVVSTMDHRILMGTGMAMGWPIGIGLIHIAKGRGRSRRCLLLWISVAMMIVCCYYSVSRGPWIAAILAGAGLVALLPPRTRQPLIYLGVLAVLALIARPGVLETLTLRTEATFADEGLKRSTFLYRIELWKIAFTAISKSPWKLLFGHGPGAAGSSEFQWELSYSGSDHTIWSWDNHYAALLYNTGLLGLTAFLLIHGVVLLRIYRQREGVDSDRQIMLTCILASAIVFVFMMSNVFIFAPQLNYVFWSLVAAGMGLGSGGGALVDHEDKSLPGCDQCTT